MLAKTHADILSTLSVNFNASNIISVSKAIWSSGLAHLIWHLVESCQKIRWLEIVEPCPKTIKKL